MRRSSTRWRRPTRPPFALLVAVLFVAGCVTQGRYEGVEAKNRELHQRVEHLEASARSLETERTKLLGELEDLRITSEREGAELSRLKRSEADLSTRLSRREKELAASLEAVDELRSTYEGLLSDLEEEVASGQIEIEQLRGGLRLNMTQDVLFASGSSRVNSTGQAVLRKVAERLKEVPHHVVVEGHTDDVPIRSSRYPTNWELAGGRAAGVVRILETEGVDPARLSAISRGETQPRDSNATPEGRARNRRIEVTLEPVRDVASGASDGADGPPAEVAPGS